MTRYTYLLVLAISFVLSSCSMDEGGVRVSNNMEKYALEYLEDSQLLSPNEKILANYDYTIALDGTEAAILTDSRLIYHNANTMNTIMDITDIVSVDHHEESLIGDVIEVTNSSGELMIIEIAPYNQGSTFLKILRSKVEQ